MQNQIKKKHIYNNTDDNTLKQKYTYFQRGPQQIQIINFSK